ncbi:MAG: DUF2911 domain-containing protein [bacterium]|nr:DUF2911 domain-containing protein [bacterium]
MKFLTLLACATAMLVASLSAQELKLPALSPTATLTQEFSTSKIEIVYSRPSARGRKVMGELVPFGEVWRTGANSATKVTFGEDVWVGGKEVKAGTYSLYTKPTPGEWEVIINKNTGNWGAFGYAVTDDVARFNVRPTMLHGHDMVETFTIWISDITYSTCNIKLAWENTEIVIPVKSNNSERLMASIDKAINTPNIPYQQAATYYYETNQNLETALVYADKAIEQNPKAFWMYHTKAKIAAKLGKKDVAIAAANKSIEVAKGGPAEAEYTRNNQKLIDSLK